MVLTTWGNYTSRAGLQVKTKHPVSNDAGKHSSPNNPYFKLNSLWLVIIRSKCRDDHTPTSNQCHRTASPFQMWSRTVFLYQDTKQIHATAGTHLDLHYLKFSIKKCIYYIYVIIYKYFNTGETGRLNQKSVLGFLCPSTWSVSFSHPAKSPASWRLTPAIKDLYPFTPESKNPVMSA